MPIRTLTVPLLAAVFAVAACSQTRPPPKPPLGQASFASYRQETRQWLRQHRQFLGADIERELDYNSPHEWRPAGAPRGGVLLVHGLGDSPFSFVDIAPRLAQQGWLVRTVLLPGHGSTPQSLLPVAMADWQQVVREQTQLLQREVGRIWLGGFSTGGNLVLGEALANAGIAGLLLFSPGLKSDSRLDWLTPWLAPLRPWLRPPEPGRAQQTPVRYLNVPTNGFGQYYRSSASVRAQLARQPYPRPVLMVLSEHDSVLDVRYTLAQFSQRFSHPHSRLIWYGNAPASSDHRVLWRPDRLPQQRISQFSHMSVLFAPDNPLYGRDGSLRLCQNGQDAADDAACRNGATVWYSDWGYREAGKVHARLTFNPYFDWQLQQIQQLLAGSSAGDATLQQAADAR
ncbi:alpha/beta hydrolase [Vogesella indigofera]|uniref:Alpha/beta hydrolase n=1 Tax=Vogesella indigofera TaxID=45465 RepID=A0ABT5I5R7_VOGIN|nr:alpha/beta hydrolase [Vogesella indigofera]MDC7690836.1 alpha/beta hydrolase [Vogesella indigofera]